MEIVPLIIADLVMMIQPMTVFRIVLSFGVVQPNMMNVVYVVALGYRMENVTVMVMFLIALEHVMVVQ